MLTIKVEGIGALSDYLEALQRNQLRFGIAKGLTDLANAARDQFVSTLPNKFALRTMWWKPRSKYGFNVQMAKKDNLTAAIYTRAPWMMLQESGGIRTGQGHRLAIPTAQVRRTKRELIQKSQKPLALTKAFPIKLKSGKSMLAMRVGRGKSSQLRFMYTLAKQAQVPERLHFMADIEAYVNANGMKHMEAGIDYALRTAK